MRQLGATGGEMSNSARRKIVDMHREIESLQKALAHEKWLRERAEDFCKAVQDQRESMREAIRVALNSGPDEWHPYTVEQGRAALAEAIGL